MGSIGVLCSASLYKKTKGGRLEFYGWRRRTKIGSRSIKRHGTSLSCFVVCLEQGVSKQLGEGFVNDIKHEESSLTSHWTRCRYFISSGLPQGKGLRAYWLYSNTQRTRLNRHKRNWRANMKSGWDLPLLPPLLPS